MNNYRSKDKCLNDPHLLLGQIFMGCLVHGVGKYMYVGRPHVGKGANFTVECLSRALEAVKAELRTKKLPDVLYIQLDNCSGDNKTDTYLPFAHT